MQNQQQHYLCTRPRLYSLLKASGCTLVRTVNPFDSSGSHDLAWDVILDHRAAHIISGFYAREGKPAPRSVAEFLAAGGERQ